jgi:hypothetical protein
VPLVRKPFVDFLAELAAHLAAGRSEDGPIAETMQLKVIEVAPGDWRLRMVLNHEVEVIGDESFSTQQEAIEATIDRLVDCIDADQISTRSTIQ